MATEPATETTLQGPAAWEEEAEKEHVHGLGPWKLGLRRLRRNKVALLFGLLFVLLVRLVRRWRRSGRTRSRRRTATENHLSDVIKVDGEDKNVVGLDGVPIGPQWLKADGKFFLGADRNGRDIMVRLLYGGRNSLMIGITAALITVFLSIVLGLVSGYFRGPTDTVIRALLDVMWSFPVIILGTALGVALALGGLKIGPIQIAGDSLGDTDPDYRLRLRAVHGEADPRPGAVAPREGVRRGRPRAGRGPDPDHVQRGAAEPCVDDPRLLHAPDRQRDPARGGAVLPRRRRAAAEPRRGAR